MYWDHIHPTAGVQALWAEGFRAAIPEPSTCAMILLGFTGLGYVGHRKAKTRSASFPSERQTVCKRLTDRPDAAFLARAHR